ncbi:MAG: extracellular solute-binding protein [Ruminococcaceae bacterium]|nr:extracellular solute-binding protein [Oscillospiraceae bacterium]
MKLTKRIFCGLLTTALAVTSVTACSGSTTTSSTDSNNTTSSQTTSSTDNGQTSESTDSTDENNGGSIQEAPSNGTVMKWLGYYDLNTDDKVIVDQFEDAGYTVEYIATQSGAIYFEKLAQLVSSDDSPDLVRYEWMSFPHGISKNLYMPLDNYIDFDSPTWSGMKSTIDSFNYAGKHYYIPYQMNPGVVLLYNKTALENEGISDDPFELYQNGEWTWDTWKELMVEWCNLGDDYYGLLPTGFVAMPFIVTTGTPLIDVDGESKQILNNMKEANIQRCQDFLQSIAQEGLVQPEYQDPSTVFADGKILFAEFGLDWGYTSAQKKMRDSEIYFVPIPRDPKSDAYYTNSDTFGYLVPAGSKNVKASLKYMELCRLAEIDPENAETAKDEALADAIFYPKCPECGVSNPDKLIEKCPECNADRRPNKTHVPMPEELYDLKMELKNPESDEFTFLFDDCFGFSTELTDMLQVGDAEGGGCILGGPLKTGESYTTLRDSYFGTVESHLQPYRDLLAAME